MKTRARRRLTMGDILFLIAATAMGLALARAAGPSFPGPYVFGGLHRIWDWPALVAATMTLAWVPLRLRRPRPLLRRLARHPGSAAGFAAAAAVILGSAGWAAFVSSRPERAGVTHWPTAFQTYSTYFWHRCGPSVLGGWVVLLLVRRRRRRADWVDWLGLFLGFYWAGWVVLIAIGPALARINPHLY